MLKVLLLAFLSAVRVGAQDSALNVPALVQAFAEFDLGVNEGKGLSERKGSAALGWGESRYLDAYIRMYEVSGDRRWLDRVVDHFDRMIASMQDHDGDGIPGWQTDRYSVTHLKAGPLHNRGTVRIVPEAARESNIRKTHESRAAQYVIEWLGPERIQVSEFPSGKQRYIGGYVPGNPIPEIAGWRVQLEGGEASIGDRFFVETTSVRPLEYAAHEGMVAYPIAKFIEIVLGDSELSPAYGEKARSYLDVIERRMLVKQERHWLETAPGVGAYRFTPAPWERAPNQLMPHNQYLALARAYLVLKDVSENSLFAERAAAMARHFRQNLEVSDEAYVWSYVDWVENGEKRRGRVEDTSHGAIDIEFAVEACLRGVAFNDEDLRRFARTLMDFMWNKSKTDPSIGRLVSSNEGEAKAFAGWIELSRWDPKIWDLYWTMFQKLDQPALDIPRVLHAAKVKGTR